MKYTFPLLLMISLLFPQMAISCSICKTNFDGKTIVGDSLGKAEEKPFQKLSQLINEYAENEIHKGNINSIALAIYRNGEVFHNYYGEIDKNARNKPNDNTLYEIASISKVFVGSLTAKALLEGKIKLDDDIRLYLKGEYQNLEYENTPITIKNLLTHTLGFKTKTPTKLEEINRKTSEGYFENYSTLISLDHN